MPERNRKHAFESGSNISLQLHAKRKNLEQSLAVSHAMHFDGHVDTAHPDESRVVPLGRLLLPHWNGHEWVWLKISQEGQTAGFGPGFHSRSGNPFGFPFFLEPQPSVSGSSWYPMAGRRTAVKPTRCVQAPMASAALLPCRICEAPGQVPFLGSTLKVGETYYVFISGW